MVEQKFSDMLQCILNVKRFLEKNLSPKHKKMFSRLSVSCFTLELQGSIYYFMITLYSTLSVCIKMENINFNQSLNNNY